MAPSRLLWSVLLAWSAAANPAEGACPAMVSKEEWGGVNATRVEWMEPPVPFVVIHHTYMPAACSTAERCESAMRSMQRFHMSKGWNDIGYSFVIGGDNRIYVGRGWDVVGAHAPRYNSRSVGISFIGDYRTVAPSDSMLALAKQVIECGIERGSLRADYKLVGHRQVRLTECPGDALFDVIRTWDHWDPLVDIVLSGNSSASSTTSTTPTTSAVPPTTDPSHSSENVVNVSTQ